MPIETGSTAVRPPPRQLPSHWHPGGMRGRGEGAAPSQGRGKVPSHHKRFQKCEFRLLQVFESEKVGQTEPAVY